MQFAEVVKEIYNGNFDEQLDELQQQIDLRRKYTKIRKTYSMRVGDYVKINGNLRPAYIVGHVAKITKVNQATIEVDFLQPIYGPQKSRPWHKKVKVPINCVETTTNLEVEEYKKYIPPVRENRWDKTLLDPSMTRRELEAEARAEMEFERRANRY